ncbi:MAG: hypothetical protein ACKPKO_03300, partial [Candidatus Fonsibacter sp.]
KIPVVIAQIQDDFASLPPCNAPWTIDQHDMLLSKVFRQIWLRNAEKSQAIPSKPWITEEVWSALRQHAALRKSFAERMQFYHLSICRLFFPEVDVCYAPCPSSHTVS